MLDLICRGTPCICIYSSRNLITLGLVALSKTSTVRYLEKRSIQAKNCILIFSLTIGPTKTSWISSLGSEQFSNGCHFDAGMTGFRFLWISVQGLHCEALLTSVIIPQLPGWVRCNDSRTPSCIECAMATRSSTQTHSEWTCRSHQYEWG